MTMRTRTDVLLLPIPATQEAESLGSPRLTNMVMLGAAMAQVQAVSIDALSTALAAHLPAHHRDLLGVATEMGNVRDHPVHGGFLIEQAQVRAWMAREKPDAVVVATGVMAVMPQRGTLAILWAHVVFNTAVVLRVVSPRWALVDREMIEAAESLGAPPWRVFTQVTWPAIRAWKSPCSARKSGRSGAAAASSLRRSMVWSGLSRRNTMRVRTRRVPCRSAHHAVGISNRA